MALENSGMTWGGAGKSEYTLHLRPRPHVSGYLNPQLFLSGYGFRPHASGEFGSESGYFCYVWTGKFLNPERKSCGFKNIRIRVDRAYKYPSGNSSFLSGLKPLYQSEAWRTIIHLKMRLISM